MSGLRFVVIWNPPPDTILRCRYCHGRGREYLGHNSQGEMSRSCPAGCKREERESDEV